MIGSYQLYPSDCIEGARKYISDNSVDLIITDPPYGIEADKLHRHYHRHEEKVINGYVEIPREKYPSFSNKWIKEAERILRPGGSLHVISGYSNLADILNALQKTSGREKSYHLEIQFWRSYTKKIYFIPLSHSLLHKTRWQSNF